MKLLNDGARIQTKVKPAPEPVYNYCEMLPQPSGRGGIQTPNIWGQRPRSLHYVMVPPSLPGQCVISGWVVSQMCGSAFAAWNAFLIKTKTIIGECRPNLKTAKFVFNRLSCHLSSSNLISKAWTLGLYKSQKSVFLIPTSDSPILLPNRKWLHVCKLWNWRCRVELKLLMWL